MRRIAAAIAIACAHFAGVETANASRSSGVVTCSNHGCSDARPMHSYRYGGEVESPRTDRKRIKARAVRERPSRSSSLVSIQCGPRQIKVAASAARQFAGFCSDLYASYKFKAVGGFRPGKCWTGGKHPCGGAVDIEQWCRSCVTRAFPVRLTEQLSDRYGLQAGSRWGYRDTGHFEIKGGLASNGWTPKTAAVIAGKADDPAPRRWPIAHSEIERTPSMQGDDLLAKVRPIADAALYSIYSEVPPKTPQERPVVVLLASMGDIPLGTPREEVDRAADLFKLDPAMMRAFVKIESGYRCHLQTNSYIGLLQLSRHLFNRYGSGKIKNCRDNAIAGAHKFATEIAIFRHAYGRDPEFWELYLMHQQGPAGAEQHLAQPYRLAYESMCATEEGKRKGIPWCKKAIWGNVPADLKRAIKGGVDALTSSEFVAFWRNRVDQIATGIADIVKPKQYAKAKAKKRYAKRSKKRHRHYQVAAVR